MDSRLHAAVILSYFFGYGTWLLCADPTKSTPGMPAHLREAVRASDATHAARLQGGKKPNWSQL